MPILDNLWIIPLLPLLGSAINGLFGAKWPNKIVNSVAVGSTGLAFACALARQCFINEYACGQTERESELAGALHELAYRDAPAPVVTGEFRPGDVRHVFADPGRAERELGFSAEEDFSHGVAELAEDLMAAA